MYTADFYPTRNVVRREVMFSQGVCLLNFVGDVLHLHPIILPLVPCPFQGVPKWLVSNLVPGGTPVLSRGYTRSRQGYPPARTGLGNPLARTQDWVPPVRTGQDWGTPWKGQDWTGSLYQVMLQVVCLLHLFVAFLYCDGGMAPWYPPLDPLIIFQRSTKG